jgi:hypothetical protein
LDNFGAMAALQCNTCHESTPAVIKVTSICVSGACTLFAISKTRCELHDGINEWQIESELNEGYLFKRSLSVSIIAQHERKG